MVTMQAFYERLSTTAGTTSAYQHHLALLTQASHTQILKFKSNMEWTVWWSE